MIGKGKAILHTKASIQYGWNQQKNAEIVYKKHLLGESPKEITQEFQMIQSQNINCEKNTFSFVISPTVEDGQKLNIKDLNKITSEFLKELKLNQHQAIAFVHNDKDHKHIHLYVNRIDFNGKAYNDSFIGKYSQIAAEKVAKKLELQTVKQIQEEKLKSLKVERKNIKQIHDKCIKDFSPKNHLEYQTAMKELGVKVKPVINKSGRLQGYRYDPNGINLKGSEVHRSLSINKLNLQLEPTIKIAKQIIKTVSKASQQIGM